MVVYFSGTGNSKYVAERIAGSLQEKLICMNERIKSGDTGSVKTGENLVVVVPTYAWRIPRVVSDWIGQTEFVGVKNVWYVMSCGSVISPLATKKRPTTHVPRKIRFPQPYAPAYKILRIF